MSYQDQLLDIDRFVGIHPFTTDVLDSPSDVIKRLRKGRKLTSGETLITDVGTSSSTREFSKIEKLIESLLLSGRKPLWQCEEVTPRNMSIKSIESLENFIKNVIDAFSVLQSCKELKENWTQVALQWATSCSSRHYAGRSFQVLRLLCPPLNWSAFSDILSRLCDTATDLNEDVQGYVLEILLTLETAVDTRLLPLKKAVDENLNRRKSDNTSLLKRRKNSAAEMYSNNHRGKNRQRNRSSISGNSIINVTTKSGSRSESISSITEELQFADTSDENPSEAVFNDVNKKNDQNDDVKDNTENNDRNGNNFNDDNLITEEELTLFLSEESRDLLARIFWVCVCLLESDYEHEFLLSLRIINKLFKSLRFCKIQFYSNLQIILKQMEWTNYPGLHALLLKGLTIPSIATSTLHLLSWLTPDNENRIIDPSQRIALPLSIIAILPYLSQNFEKPDEFCMSCAQSFGLTCEKSHTLSNVSTLLKLYTEKKYPQPCQVWLSAVCKYINDAYPDLLTTILTFLLEVLEFCPDNVRREHLLVLQSYVKHIDLLSSDVQQWGGELIRTICRSLTGSYWAEALEIIKLVVAKSSSVNSPQDGNELRDIWRLDTFGGMVKKELPGPTLNFNYDLSSTKIISFNNTSYPMNLIHSRMSSDNDEDDELEIEKMCAAQNRTRNCLRLLTATCGNKSALIKNSYQSIVFSSTSSMQAFDRRQTIEKSSSDEALMIDEVPHKSSDFRRKSLIGVVTDFDFLDDEYKVNEEANSPLFNWASVSVLHSPSAESIISTTQEEINLRKDLSELVSICKEIYESSDDDSQSTVDDEESVEENNVKRDSDELSVLPVTQNAGVPELIVEHKCDVEVPVVDIGVEKLSESGTEISQDSSKLVTYKADSHISLSSIESSVGMASEETYKRGSSASEGGIKEISDMWQMHVSAVIAKRISNKQSCTHQIFIKTFDSIAFTYQRLTDKSREITQSDDFQGIILKLSHISQLFYQVEIPYVFTDWESLTETGLMQEHTFHVIELHNYCNCIFTLTDKLWEQLYEITAMEDICETVVVKKVQESRIQLYVDLYEIAFNFILLLEAYNKNIRALSMAISKTSKVQYSYYACFIITMQFLIINNCDATRL